jgi:glutaredoxin 3
MSNAKIEIFTIPGCAWCSKAKKVFEANGYDFQEISLSSEENIKKFEEAQEKYHFGNNVPQIIINDEFVGGYLDLHKCVMQHDSVIKCIESFGIDDQITPYNEMTYSSDNFPRDVDGSLILSPDGVLDPSFIADFY